MSLNQYRAASAAAVGLVMTVAATHAQTVAYWRFEDGPAKIDIPHSTPDGFFEPSVVDVSGNGNHLSVWSQGGCCGYIYRSNVSSPVIPGTGEANTLSVKNTGCCPGMFTHSLFSVPTGIDIEAITPAQFTVEASFKVENGGFRTIVGRDATQVTANPDLAALYLQVNPENAMAIVFVDVSGFEHRATSAPGLIQGFDFPTDPDGETAPWYNVAAVSDGATLTLYVNGVIAAITDLTASGSPDTSLARGFLDGPDWHAGEWSVGRGLYGGQHVDRAYGYIDEVRISNAALKPSEMLFGGSDCSADFNGDGAVNSQDFFDFLVPFFAEDLAADFNGDNMINSQDFFDFLTAFFTGC